MKRIAWAAVGTLATVGCGSATDLDLLADVDGGSPVSLGDAAISSGEAAADSGIDGMDATAETDAMDLSSLGTVVVLHAVDEVSHLEYLSVSADFIRYQDPNGIWFENYLYSPSCHVQTLGACSWVSCLATEPAVEASAGTITVQGGTGPITLEPLGMGYGFGGDAGSPFIFTGAPLQVIATGAEFPPFQTPPVTMPADIKVTSPVATSNTAPGITISKSGLPITWTGGGDGSVEVHLAAWAGSAGIPATFVRCAFPAQAGSATIAPDVLSGIPPIAAPKGGASIGLLSVFPINHATATGQRWKVDVQAAGVGANFNIGTISP